MENTENKNEKIQSENIDVDVKRKSDTIDVNKYIHVEDERQIGLDIFKESEKYTSSRNNSQKNSLKENLPDSIRKKVSHKKNKMNSKTRVIIFSIVIFVLIISVGLGTVFTIVAKKNNRIDVNFRYSTENKEVGTVNNKIKRQSKYAYGLYYPTFGKKTIDEAVEKQNEAIIDAFLSKYKNYNSSQKGKGAIMFSDYTSTDFVDYYQIVRKTEYRIPDENTSEYICTLFYDVKNDKIIKGSDFFDNTFRQIVSVKIENYLKNNTDMSSDEIEALTDYTKIKFNNFSMDKDNLYIYVNGSDGSTITVKLPLDSSITGHFKISYKTLSDFYNLAHQSDEQTTSQLSDDGSAAKY